MEEEELELIHDEKFGELLDFDVIDIESGRPIIIAILRHKGMDYLAIHKGFVKGNEIHYGKGVRIPIDDGSAETVLLACQGLVLQLDPEME